MKHNQSLIGELMVDETGEAYKAEAKAYGGLVDHVL
jgi:hypothetical protein